MILAHQKNQILNCLSPYQPTRVGIFGSYARDEQRLDSDLDILVSFEKRINLFDLIGIEMELSELLGIKVDLVSEQAILPALRPFIDKDLKNIL